MRLYINEAAMNEATGSLFSSAKTGRKSSFLTLCVSLHACSTLDKKLLARLCVSKVNMATGVTYHISF